MPIAGPPDSAAWVGSGVRHGLPLRLQGPGPHLVGQVAWPHWLGPLKHICGQICVRPCSQHPLRGLHGHLTSHFLPSFFKTLPTVSLINLPVSLLLLIPRYPLLGAPEPY